MLDPNTKRRDVPEEYTWDLTDLFPDDEAWRAEYESLREAPEQLAAYQGRLGENAAELLAFLRLNDELELRVTRLHGYANCKADQDLGEGTYQDMRAKAVNVAVALSGAGAFAAPEIMAIPDETLDGFHAAEPALDEYRRSLYRIRRRRAHILSPAEEKLLAAAGEMAGAPDQINGVLTDVDFKFPDVADAQGTMHTLTNGSFVPLEESPDRVLRKNAFEAYYARYEAFRNTSAALLDAQFRQLRFYAEARGYQTTLHAALDETEVPVDVYLNLIGTVHDNLDKLHRYVALRKKRLGVDELHMYDIYTPIVADAARKIPFDEAKATVLDALAVLGEDYTALLREGFEHRWLDVYENAGKRGGAYSSGTSRPHPYVLLNHKDTLDSMFTIAHEMGHALHSYHSCKHQPVSTSGYVIFVAEVASTCNEVLLMRYLLNRTTDRKERAYLINHFLDAFKGTVYRQAMFAEFELELGRMTERGEALTAEALCDKYLALNRLYYGDGMVSDPGIAVEWARIPHFYYDYYVFQYATGFSAAVALADRILTEGAAAVADYKKFLSGGSSADPISLLKLAGVDMGTSAPVNAALSLFGELLDEMERLD